MKDVTLAEGSAGGVKALHDQAARLLLASIQDYAIYVLDPTGHVLSWNAGAERIKGYRADEIIGKHYGTFFTPEDRDRAEPERELTTAITGRFEVDAWRVRRDGTRFWANVILTPMHDDSGELVGFAKITRDLTERRHREEERARFLQVEEALRVRDEFYTRTQKSLGTMLISLRVHVETLTSTIGPYAADRVQMRAKLQMLEWGIDKLVKVIDEVHAAANAALEGFAKGLNDAPERPKRRSP
jgi:PAS domain S-box-containing protein